MEWVASIIVGLAALLLKTLITARKEKEAAHETKREELREALAENDTAAVHGVLGSQHDRVREALRGGARQRTDNHNQTGTGSGVQR